MGRTRILSGLFAVLVLAGTGYADLPAIPRPDSHAPAERASRSPASEFESLVTASLAASHGFCDRPLPPLAFEGQALEEANPPYVLTDRQNGLHLCLYTLLGLGLCKSAPWVKKLSLGVLPGWYHDGGPFQIGHSLAISPDCLCLAVVCFIQPQDKAEDLQPLYRLGAVAALWREAQFVPAVLAARGPPFGGP